MSMSSGQAAVTDTAAALGSASDAGVTGRTFIVAVNQGSNTVYLGGTSAVTSSTGFRLLAGAGVSLDGISPVQMFAICATGLSSTVDFLYVVGE